jgi:hypothetical protein
MRKAGVGKEGFVMTNKEYKCDYWLGCGEELYWCDGHVMWTLVRKDPIILCDECFKELVSSHVPLGWYHKNFQKGQTEKNEEGGF